MGNILIKDFINEKPVILTSEYVQYSSSKIYFEDIVDYYFYNSISTINLLTYAKCLLVILTDDKNEIISIETSVNCSLIGINKSKQEQIRKTSSLYEKMFPVLVKQYVIHAIKKIEENKHIVVANILFDKNGIHMSTKVGFGEKVFIPYKFAIISDEFRKFGLLYTGGHAAQIELIDTSTHKSYIYSNNIRNQPVHGEILKAIELLQHIKKNKLLEFNNTDNNSKVL